MTARSGPSRVARTTLLIAALAVAPVLVAAHPLSTTSVLIVVDAGRLDVTLTMDAAALAAKVDTDVLSEAGPALERALHLQAGDSPVDLRMSSLAIDARNEAVVHLTAAISSRIDHVSWQTPLTLGAYSLTVRANGIETIRWIQGRDTSGPIALDSASLLATIRRGVWLGFTHIVPKGLDHILFVAGLALLRARRRDLLVLVTSFTLAHSVTLGLGLYGFVSLPARIVEPLIALSVAYVGVENLMAPGPAGRRAAVVFAFGLLHGLGFAGVLAELTTSPATRLATLFSFNTGVELGQLAVLSCTLLTLAAIAAVRARAEWYAARGLSAGVGLMGMFWTVQRLIG